MVHEASVSEKTIYVEVDRSPNADNSVFSNPIMTNQQEPTDAVVVYAPYDHIGGPDNTGNSRRQPVVGFGHDLQHSVDIT